MFLFRPNNNQKDGVEEIESGVVEKDSGGKLWSPKAPVKRSGLRSSSGIVFHNGCVAAAGKKLSEKK